MPASTRDINTGGRLRNNVQLNTFDLTSLGGVRTVTRTRDTPPTKVVDSLRFDLCEELKLQDGVSEHDQCPPGTRACLTKINQRTGEQDRIVAVIPMAQSANLEPISSANSSPKYLSLVFHGAEYPAPPLSMPVRQSLNLTILCNPQETSEPKFIAYDGSRLDLEWTAPAGCPFKEEEEDKGGGGDNKEEPTQPENVGSGIGWFFLVILLAFIAYFGLGAYYNYSTYGARGLDLIPHRDFWKEVPYMLSDVASHLCSNVRPRRTSSRGGYVAV
ncbi:Autophagy-related protein 27 [Psilocybe cubensis]|uniref:Autophagy-related protein 27 n=2 Tax=Psilocybe cubensis TaxID=181762 RepID=A0ACB8HBQ8_PSICU|nr:Autophagy-related protein 27 [Psilocybe cubensis]KAH9485376.1 Autophagy-related protein 27 [Psilocybe cubensis]